MADRPQIDTSHISDFADDRGPAEHFHGRTNILDNFTQILERTTQKRGGTTMLIHGAPGAGKTALLYELEKLAVTSGWETPKNMFYPPALWTPGELRTALGQSIRSKFSIPIGIALQVVPIEIKAEWTQKKTLNILRSGKKPLLLQLDETQTMGTTNAPPEGFKSVATNMLDAIHYGKLGRPVILMAAGLGESRTAFSDLGISRFRAGCEIELGALSKEAERAVIRDWLIKDGGAKGDPTAQKTHGWPQHITAYGDAAAQQIRHDKGAMPPAGLEIVYQVGMKRREAYYKQRVNGFRGDEMDCLYGAIAGSKSGVPFNEGMIFEPLKKKYGYERAEKIFKKILDKGILSLVSTKYYVQIPSMHDWMKSELERTHEISIQAEVARNKDAELKSLAPRRDLSSSPIIEHEHSSIPNPPSQSKKKGNSPKDRGSRFDMER